jgi:hypothetical protein
MKSFSLFIAYLLFLTLSILFISCVKDYSYEGGQTAGISGGTSVYTLQEERGNCAEPVINGNYTAGIALQNSNTIILQVNVTVIGTYTFTTGVVNGIQFSSSGNFTVTGIQTIILKGNGKPLTAGTFVFTPPVGSGCAFFITVNPNSQAQFILEGAPHICSDFTINGKYNIGKPLTVDNTVDVMVYVTSVGSYSINTATIDGISFSRSGNFTSTGSQELVLNGSGVPLNSGTFTFAPISGTSSCTFNITVTASETPSNYVLASNPDGTCSGYSVPGSFYAGTPLTNNIMVVTVNVNALGNFTISTNTVNGMTFSASGNFTKLGSQTVHLIGRGTPVDIGVFVFTPKIIGGSSGDGNACNLDVYVL